MNNIVHILPTAGDQCQAVATVRSFFICLSLFYCVSRCVPQREHPESHPGSSTKHIGLLGLRVSLNISAL